MSAAAFRKPRPAPAADEWPEPCIQRAHDGKRLTLYVGTACIGVAELDEAGVSWSVFNQCGRDAEHVADCTSEPAARMWLDDIAQEWRGGQW